MNENNCIIKGKGNYLGTVIDGKWWKRYRKQGFLMRGNGEFCAKPEGFYFLRYLTSNSLCILWKQVTGIDTGKWHAGRWGGGYPIMKIIWSNKGLTLSSGFFLGQDRDKFARIMRELQGLLKKDKQPG